MSILLKFDSEKIRSCCKIVYIHFRESKRTMSEVYKALLAADMDFTLLAPGKDVPEGNKKAIKALKEAGVAFTIATGRSSFLVGKFAEDKICKKRSFTIYLQLVFEAKISISLSEEQDD